MSCPTHINHLTTEVCWNQGTTRVIALGRAVQGMSLIAAEIDEAIIASLAPPIE
eukprot:m.190805 g.190805  ORF g.190805 m.190805 type:complete len:54 (-) comp14830_c0_seq1:2530-2691(-)